jgi:hypothetical protein
MMEEPHSDAWPFGNLRISESYPPGAQWLFRNLRGGSFASTRSGRQAMAYWEPGTMLGTAGGQQAAPAELPLNPAGCPMAFQEPGCSETSGAGGRRHLSWTLQI